MFRFDPCLFSHYYYHQPHIQLLSSISELRLSSVLQEQEKLSGKTNPMLSEKEKVEIRKIRGDTFSSIGCTAV